MEENIYQSPTTNPENPLVSNIENQPSVKSKKFTIPKDPKIKILLALSVVLVILLIAALVATIVRNAKPRVQTNRPVPTQSPSPTPTVPAIIPTQYLQDFQKAEQEVGVSTEIAPPKIDEEIGL